MAAPDDLVKAASRLEAALDRIESLATRVGVGKHGAVKVESKGDGPSNAELAARLDVLIEHVHTALSSTSG